MLLSVIIPTCNRNDLLSKCLDLLSPMVQCIEGSKYEVIVTDDSKDNIAKQLIEEKYKWAKWISGPKKGPAANRNNGAKNANGDWLIFIDDDCLPDKNVLAEYKNAIENNKDVLVFEGCIKADRLQRSFAEESPINDKGGHLWSCNFMIEKKLFVETLNGFDEGFPYAAMEDVEFNYRLQNRNIKIVFLQKAIVIHPWRIQKNVISISIKRFKSTLYFLNKYPSKKNDINSIYYLRAFYYFSSDLIKNMFKYNFRGFGTRVVHNFLHLYFSLHMIFV